MRNSSRHSKGKAIAMYLGLATMLCATAVIDDVALGFLSNLQAYVNVHPVQETAVAGVGSPSTYAFNGTATSINR